MRTMKFLLKYNISILILSMLTISISCNHRNENQARKFLGFSLSDKSLTSIEENEEWNNNPGGDGWEYVIFSFESKDSLKIKKECIAKKFKNLPIEESELPDGAIYKFIDTRNRDGYYKLEIDSIDKMSYSLAVVDLNKRNIVVYCGFY